MNGTVPVLEMMVYFIQNEALYTLMKLYKI
jgi:hypothetical protein